MKIGFFETEGFEQEIFTKEFPQEEFYFSDKPLDKDKLPGIKDLDILSIFVGSKIDTAVIDYFTNLKYIATRSMGFDHIDLEATARKSILVSNVPHYGGETVAEWTFALILNLLRKVYKAVDQVKETGSFEVKQLRGVELAGKTLGVIGTGRIGREVIKLGKCFGMKIIAFDVKPDITFAQEIGFEYKESLVALLPQADIITLHVNYMPATHHLINKQNIKLIKRGGYLINTSRGPVVETEAICQALANGFLAGAGLDVLEEEGVIKDEIEFLIKGHPEEHNLKTVLADHLLMKMDNVLITPHNAFNSQEALQRIMQTTIENIRGFITGKPVNLLS